MTLEQAREFFRQFNGSSFHMSREEPQLLKQFEEMNISNEQKDQWRLQLAQEYLDSINRDNPQSWSLFSRLTEVLKPVKTFTDRQEDMIIEAIERQTGSDLLTRTISLETICGRTYDYHDGIIAYFRKMGYDMSRLKEASDSLFEEDGNTDDSRFAKAIRLYHSLID